MNVSSEEWDQSTEPPTTVALPKLELFPTEYRIVATIVHTIILVTGVFGNISVVLVVQRTKFIRTPTYYYLVSLAVADLLVLLSALPEAIISYQLYKRQWIFGPFGCSLWVFVSFLGINVSTTSILCFTAERYIGICKPLLAQKLCTTDRAQKIILATWVMGVLYSFPWLFLTGTNPHPSDPTMERCDYKLNRQQYVYYYMSDIVLFYVLPLIGSIALYVKIATALRNSISYSPSPAISRCNSWAFRTRERSVKGGSVLRKHTRDGPVEEERPVVKMLFLIVVLFALLWLPYRALLVYNSFVAKPYLNIWYLLFAKTAVFINSAINPLMYNAMSKRFRRAFLHIILRGSKGGSPEDTWVRTSFIQKSGGGLRASRSPSLTAHYTLSVASRMETSEAVEGDLFGLSRRRSFSDGAYLYQSEKVPKSLPGNKPRYSNAGSRLANNFDLFRD